MSLLAQSPANIAAALVRFAGRNIDIAATEANYRRNAVDMRSLAAKAANAKSGKVRGYTESKALEMAELNERNAVEVIAELRKILGA